MGAPWQQEGDIWRRLTRKPRRISTPTLRPLRRWPPRLRPEVAKYYRQLLLRRPPTGLASDLPRVHRPGGIVTPSYGIDPATDIRLNRLCSAGKSPHLALLKPQSSHHAAGASRVGTAESREGTQSGRIDRAAGGRRHDVYEAERQWVPKLMSQTPGSPRMRRSARPAQVGTEPLDPRPGDDAPTRAPDHDRSRC